MQAEPFQIASTFTDDVVLTEYVDLFTETFLHRLPHTKIELITTCFHENRNRFYLTFNNFLKIEGQILKNRHLNQT